MTIAAVVGSAPTGGLPDHLVTRLVSHVVSDGTLEPIVSSAPFTREKLADIPQSSDSDLEVAFAFASDAQRRWVKVPIKQRCQIMMRFYHLMMANRDEALDVVQWETGKARRDALEEFLDVCVTARYYARTAERLLRPRSHSGALPLVIGVKESMQPKGVVGIIAPWNYPMTLAVSDAIPALLAGNAVVLKPDSDTPLTALWVVDLLRRAGIPEGLLEVVIGAGRRLGPQIVDHSDYLMFTGSTAVGRILAAQCGQRLIGCSMELGGKNAIIILEDANLDRAAEVAVRACFGNGGQLCISMERMYIAETIYEEFLDRFLRRVRNMRLAAKVGWGADMGSLISQQQLETVASHVDNAVSHGATVLAGGKARPDLGPYFYEPTVLAGVTEDMILCRQETFGPVVSVHRFSTPDEAVERANDTKYGLNASIISRDTSAARRLAARLRTGTVNINEGYAAAWGSVSSSMGGFSDSGIGRRHGAEGLLKYVEAQTVATQRVLGFGAPRGMSDKQWGDSLTGIVQAMTKLGMK